MATLRLRRQLKAPEDPRVLKAADMAEEAKAEMERAAQWAAENVPAQMPPDIAEEAESERRIAEAVQRLREPPRPMRRLPAFSQPEVPVQSAAVRVPRTPAGRMLAIDPGLLNTDFSAMEVRALSAGTTGHHRRIAQELLRATSPEESAQIMDREFARAFSDNIDREMLSSALVNTLQFRLPMPTGFFRDHHSAAFAAYRDMCESALIDAWEAAQRNARGLHPNDVCYSTAALFQCDLLYFFIINDWRNVVVCRVNDGRSWIHALGHPNIRPGDIGAILGWAMDTYLDDSFVHLR
jgi:hypothetical protein